MSTATKTSAWTHNLRRTFGSK